MNKYTKNIALFTGLLLLVPFQVSAERSGNVEVSQEDCKEFMANQDQYQRELEKLGNLMEGAETVEEKRQRVSESQLKRFNFLNALREQCR